TSFSFIVLSAGVSKSATGVAKDKDKEDGRKMGGHLGQAGACTGGRRRARFGVFHVNIRLSPPCRRPCVIPRPSHAASSGDWSMSPIWSWKRRWGVSACG